MKYEITMKDGSVQTMQVFAQEVIEQKFDNGVLVSETPVKVYPKPEDEIKKWHPDLQAQVLSVSEVLNA